MFSICSLSFLISAMRSRSDCQRERRAATSSRSEASSLGDLVEAGLGLRALVLAEQGLAFDLEAGDPALALVDRQGHALDLHLEAGGGLVDEVDRLVGEEAVLDVAVAQAGGGDDRGVHDADAVVGLELVADAAEDRDRVLDAGLVDHHRLEAALERLVLLDVLAVLVEGRRADAAQLAAGEGRLEHVGGVLGALGLAGADEGVELVDEQDDLAVGGLDLLEHGLEALLEFAAVLGAGDEGGEVELEELAVLEALGDVAGGDAQGDALGDRGLADAGVADQDGVVLGAARQHLDRAADLDVAADHRVELRLAGGLGQVAAVLGERPRTCPRASRPGRSGSRGSRRAPRAAGRGCRRACRAPRRRGSSALIALG
jgi:hypothetical protein